MLIDKTKSEYLNILDHINKLIPPSSTAIQPNDITFSPPRTIGHEDLSLIPNDHPNDSYIFNTEITVSPSPTYSWELPTTVQYRRVDLQKQYYIYTGNNTGTSSSPLSLGIDNQKTDDLETQKNLTLQEILKILPILREESLQLTGGFTISSPEDKEATYVLAAKENSLLYIGQLIIKCQRHTYTSEPPPNPKDPPNDPSHPKEPPAPEKIPIKDIFNKDKNDLDGTKSDEGDGFDYFETI